jgi:coronin-7
VYRNHSDAIQSISWKRDGSLMVSASKDKTMQIFDPRNSSKDLVQFHVKKKNRIFCYLKFLILKRIENDKTNNKDSRVSWIGDSNIILSSVYTNVSQEKAFTFLFQPKG